MKFVSGLMAIMVMSVFCASAYADPVAADKQKASKQNAEAVRQLLSVLRTSSPSIVPGETVAHYTARLEERSRLVAQYAAAVAAAKAAQ